MSQKAKPPTAPALASLYRSDRRIRNAWERLPARERAAYDDWVQSVSGSRAERRARTSANRLIMDRTFAGMFKRRGQGAWDMWRLPPQDFPPQPLRTTDLGEGPAGYSGP